MNSLWRPEGRRRRAGRRDPPHGADSARQAITPCLLRRESRVARWRSCDFDFEPAPVDQGEGPVGPLPFEQVRSLGAFKRRHSPLDPGIPSYVWHWLNRRREWAANPFRPTERYPPDGAYSHSDAIQVVSRSRSSARRGCFHGLTGLRGGRSQEFGGRSQCTGTADAPNRWPVGCLGRLDRRVLLAVRPTRGRPVFGPLRTRAGLHEPHRWTFCRQIGDWDGGRSFAHRRGRGHRSG